MSLPTVTVIAPTFRAARHIPSFFSQLVPALGDLDVEVLIVDDGSGDETTNVISQYLDQCPQARLIPLPDNIGVGRARNRAITEARGEYVWFVDVDDRWEPQILRRLLQVAKDTDADVAVCWADFRTDPEVPGKRVDGLDDDGVISGEDALRAVLAGRVHGFLWNKLFRRSLLSHDQFPPLSSQSDFVGTTTALARAERVVGFSETLYHYISVSDSISRRRSVNLDNILACYTHMSSLVHEGKRLSLERGVWEAFELRFMRLACATIPIRQNADAETVQYGLSLARENLSSVNLRDAARVAPVLAVQGAGMRYAGQLYEPTARLAYRAYDMQRDVRNKFQKERG